MEIPGAGRHKNFQESCRLRFVLSHPCDKNKDVARMGHPALIILAGIAITELVPQPHVPTAHEA